MASVILQGTADVPGESTLTAIQSRNLRPATRRRPAWV